MQKVNHRMVILARESRGLTQSELAELLEVTQGKVSKIEQDMLNVSEDTLEKLSSCLSYPTSFFSLPDAVSAHAINLHRKRAALAKKTLCKIDAHLNIRRIHLRKLLDEVEISGEGIPLCSISEYGTPEKIAQHLRKLWKVPAGPIGSVTGLIEKAGGVVINCDFESQLIDGVSARCSELPPVIFVNKESPGDRLRFTLAHELGHIVMHSMPSQEMENEADKFAAEFLMPSKDIRDEFDTVSLSHLAELKPRWKVSMASLLYRAKQLDKISPRTSQYLWMQLSKAGYRTREPSNLDIPREMPQLLTLILKVHTDELGNTPESLSEMLGVHYEEFKQLYLKEEAAERKIKRRVASA